MSRISLSAVTSRAPPTVRSPRRRTARGEILAFLLFPFFLFQRPACAEDVCSGCSRGQRRCSLKRKCGICGGSGMKTTLPRPRVTCTRTPPQSRCVPRGQISDSSSMYWKVSTATLGEGVPSPLLAARVSRLLWAL
ncbi:hypothetical protein ANANG_G00130140 [Anguilla anguilla]|uniref:Uncharacterized protein n=1 Tax=Anguilla anguilla TaxID=7936 RepID=A0A9D3MFN7_ANGAN|nr:hypothetical protein ANANG_G00130140 [Anguilla anguilla]